MVGGALPALAETAPSEKTSLIDVHHHFAPPAYVAENRSKVSPAALDWTPQKALDAMDAEGGSAMTTRPTLLAVTRGGSACFR
jgi:6-methylsalicylate decarboxylase